MSPEQHIVRPRISMPERLAYSTGSISSGYLIVEAISHIYPMIFNGIINGIIPDGRTLLESAGKLLIGMVIWSA